MDIVLSIKKQYNLAHGDTKYERKRRAEQSTSARYANLRQSESASRKSNLREQISARRARAGEGELEGEAMRRRRGQVNERACARARAAHEGKNRRKSPMPYRGALTGIHFKFRPGIPQSSWKTSARGESERADARNVGERASEPCWANCKQNKVSVSGDYGAESSGARCGVVEIAGYRKAGPKEI